VILLTHKGVPIHRIFSRLSFDRRL